MTEATVRDGHPYGGVLTRLKDDEAELVELNRQRQADNVPTQDPELEEGALGAEEQTYRKRYGDLRRHMQSTAEKHQQELLDLRKKLVDANKPKNVELPRTEEELGAFIENYPELASLIETMIEKRVRDTAGNVEERFAQLEQEKLLEARRQAAARLLQAHPDLDDIRDSESFTNWVQEQPDNIKWALWKNETDWKAAARAIDLYKRDMAETTKSTPNRKTNDDAARSVQVRRNAEPRPTPNSRKSTWSESRLARIKSNELTEEVMAEIAQAQRDGTFEYDMSGAAR